MRACYQIAGLRGKKLEQQFPQFARSTIYKHVKMPINDISPHEKCKRNTERVEKMSSRDISVSRRTFTQGCWPFDLMTRAFRERSGVC